MATLREGIGKKVLKRTRKGIVRNKRVHNFETANSAVILFDTGNPESYNVIRSFQKYLEEENISCRVFGYVDQNEIPEEYLFLKNYSFITRKDLSWFMKPTGEAADLFYSSEPDLLFDFTMEFSLEIQFLVQLSRAQLKIGCFTEKENDYDLMISLSDNRSLAYLAEQFLIYITMLTPCN